MEVSEIECRPNRLKHRSEYLKKQLEYANNILSKEREDSQVALTTASEHADIMQKIQNVNILSDSNKILREERDRLQQDYLTLEAKLKKIGRKYKEQAEKIAKEFEDFKSKAASQTPAAGDNTAAIEQVKTEMTEKLTAVEKEKADFKTKIDEQTQEINTLKEQINEFNKEKRKFEENCKKYQDDITEYEKIQTRYKNVCSKAKSKITSQKDLIERLSTENTDLRQKLNETERQNKEYEKKHTQSKNVLSTAKSKITSQKDLIERLSTENTDLRQKLNETERQNKGKQAEKIAKEFEDFKSKAASQTPAAGDNTAAIEQVKTEMTEKLTAVEKEKADFKTKIDEQTQEINTLKEQINEFNKEKSKFKENCKKYQDDITEYEKKQRESKNVLSTAKSKITSQMDLLELLSTENTDLRQKVNETERQNKEENEMRVNMLKTQYDSRISRLENELTNSRTSNTTADNAQIDRLMKENSELQAKILQLQKQVENMSKQVTPQQQVTRTPVTMAPSVSTSDAPKTANIRPMATSTAPVRPTTPIQHSSMAARVTASIRPMAIAPSTSTGGITPTATVMPTTVSQQETNDEPAEKIAKKFETPAAGDNTAAIEQVKTMTTLRAQQATQQATDSDEKAKTINQLKKIGRKYKEQAEKIAKEFEDFKSKAASQTPAAGDNTAAIEQVKTEMTEKLTAVEKEKADFKTKIDEQTQEINTLKEQINEFNKEKSKFEEDCKKYQDDITEYEKKQTQSKNVLSTAKSKITSQKDHIERLNTENTDLRQKLNETERQNKEENEMRVNMLKTQYDSRISRLENELTNSKTSNTTADNAQIDRLMKENSELQAKILQLQKQVENMSKQVTPQQQVTRTPVTMAPNVSTSDAPKTANIRPMATSTAPVRPTTPIQHSSMAARVTASIRPMAIAPSTSTGGITPTATVMPTTVSQQETNDEPATSSTPSSIPAASVTPRISTQVQIVTPQIETPTEVNVETSVPEPTPVSPILPTTGPSTETASPITPQASTSTGTTHAVTPQPSTSSSSQLGKRAREDTDSQEEGDTFNKRTRTSSQEQGIPAITVTDEHAQTITHLSPQTGSTSTSPAVEVAPLTSSADQLQDARTEEFPPSALQSNIQQTMVEPMMSSHPRRRQAVAPRNQQEEDDGDIIVLGSDDEDQGYREQMEDYREGGEEMGLKEYTESMEEDEYDDEYDEDDDEDDEDDEDDDEEDDEDIRDSNQEDSNDVVIIDDGEGQRRGSDETEQQVASIQHPVTVPVTDLPRPPANLQSMGRSQLAPFMLGPGAFDEEDGLVPSTPTLSIPIRRADGFAEAINSPAGPQRFVFGAEGSVSQPELAQLESQRALGMDDTRMDLSQFDEGRSPVPVSQLVPRSGSASTDSTSVVPSTTGTVQSTESNVTEVADVPDADNEFEDDDEALLEGLQGEEDTTDDVKPEDETGEVEGGEDIEGVPSTSTGVTHDDDKATGDNTGAGRRKIQKIVWSEEQASNTPTAPPTGPVVQHTRGRTARRGMWRGQHFTPGSRGGPRGGYRQF